MNQTDPSSLEPIRTLEQCLGNGGEFGGGVRNLGFVFLSLVTAASDCASPSYHMGSHMAVPSALYLGLLRLPHPGLLQWPLMVCILLLA